MVRMGIIPYENRQVAGPISHTHYNFSPWAMVEERDVEAMQTVSVSTGCNCASNQQVRPLFATEEQITSGKIRPVWAGKYGSPQPTR